VPVAAYTTSPVANPDPFPEALAAAGRAIAQAFLQIDAASSTWRVALEEAAHQTGVAAIIAANERRDDAARLLLGIESDLRSARRLSAPAVAEAIRRAHARWMECPIDPR
jgi:hypothetical protein